MEVKKKSAQTQEVGADDIIAAISHLESDPLKRVEMFIAAAPGLSRKDIQRITKVLFEKKGKMLMELEGNFRRRTTEVFRKQAE